MPTIFFYGPELDTEKKKELISSFTETASRLTGIERSAFVVYLRPSSPDTVGVGGELLKERLEREKRYHTCLLSKGCPIINMTNRVDSEILR